MKTAEVLADLATLGVTDPDAAKSVLADLSRRVGNGVAIVERSIARQQTTPFSEVTFEQMQATLRRITYKPNFWLRLEEWGDAFGRAYRIRADMTLPDAHSRTHETRTFSSYWVQPWPPSLDIFVVQVHQALVEMERHEASEWFRLDGQAVVNPHDERLSRRPPFADDSAAREEIRKLLRKPVTVDPRDSERLRELQQSIGVRWIDENSPLV